MVRGQEHVSTMDSPSYKQPVVNYIVSTLKTLSNPNNLPKTQPLNTIVGLSFQPFNTVTVAIKFTHGFTEDTFKS